MDDAPCAVDPARARSEPGVDALCFVELSRAHQQLLDRLLAAQITFRQRWPLVWHLILFADERHPRVDAVLPQRNRRARPGEAPADHDKGGHYTSMCSASPSTRVR